MNNLILLIICSIIVQFCTEQVKKLISSTVRADYTPFIALIIGVGVAFTTQCGIFSTFGFTLNPVWFDYAITGVAYSGGAVGFNELIKLISEKRPSNN